MTPMQTSFLYGFLGGCLIGAGSLVALIASGKVPGISGIFGRLLQPKAGDSLWRVIFLVGLISGAAVIFPLSDHAAIYRIPQGRSLLIFAVAGVFVGMGTRLGGGCTSGHGICGIGMGARDSMVATAIFMAAGFVTVAVFRMVVNG